MAVKLLQAAIIVVTAKCSLCTITGISYMDPLNFRPSTFKRELEINPCNPPYWYPRQIPEYCYTTTTETPKEKVPSSPIPVPVHVPFPPFAPSIMLPVPPMLPPHNVVPPLPISCSFPTLFCSSSPVFPILRPPFVTQHTISYSSPQQVGMIPGIPGIVSRNGGINILPFSDVYSEILERHKNKLIRKRMQKIIKDYEDFPRLRKIKKRGIYRKINYHALEE